MLYGLSVMEIVKMFAWLWVPALLVMLAVGYADYQSWKHNADVKKAMARTKAYDVKNGGLWL